MDSNTGVATYRIESEHLLGVYDNSGNGIEDYPNEDEHLHVINVTGASADLDTGRRGPKHRGIKSSSGNQNDKARGGNGAFFVQEYLHGDICDHEDVAESVIKGGNLVQGHVQRSSTVRFSCAKQWELMDINEDSTCHYLIDVGVPELCQHPLFKAPVTRTSVVKCLPV